MSSETKGYAAALQAIGASWAKWPNEPRLAGIACASLPGWIWRKRSSDDDMMLMPADFGQPPISRKDWQRARDEFLNDQRMDAIGQNGNDGEHYHYIELPSARRPLVDVMVAWLKEWPANGGTTPGVLHATDGTVTFRNLSDDHSWYAYREADGACCYWPEWYSAGRAEGLPVVAPGAVNGGDSVTAGWTTGLPSANEANEAMFSMLHRQLDKIGKKGPSDDLPEGLTFTKAPSANATETTIGTGLKYDGDKPRMDLLINGMPNALQAVGEILTFGAAKYEAHSWQTVADGATRYDAAKIRHQLARAQGESVDPETGMLHLAHEACNALFLLELALREGRHNG